jgi:long-chain fatty acid transport protein
MNIRKILSNLGFSGLLGALLVAAVPAHANGFRNPPETAAALARDGGKLTAINDASAIAANPANLSEVESPQAMGSLTLVHGETDFSSPAGSASTKDPWKALPNFFFGFPIEQQKLAAGVGLTTPYGQSTVWEEDGLFRYTAPHFAELIVLDVKPTLAARVSDVVSVGAGVDLYQSQIEFRQYVPWSTVVGAPVPDGRMDFEADGDGLGWNVGLQARLNEKQRVGITYRSAVEVDYDGDFKVSNVPAPGVAAPSSDFSTEIEFPAVVVIGYGIDLTERLSVGVDAEWVEFSSYDALPLDIGINNALLPAPALPQDWDDVWTYGVGGQYRLSDAWVLRAGYKYMESPIPDATLAPTLPDADKHQLSVGAGFRSGAHRLDVAFAYSIFADRDVSTSVNPAYNGSYDVSSELLAFTYGIDL